MLNLTFWLVVLAIILTIFELLRRKVLLEKFAVVWIFLGAMIVTGAIFPQYVNEISKFLGFQYLSNFVLFFFALINLFIIMQLSLALSRAENQIKTLAEELALIKSKIK